MSAGLQLFRRRRGSHCGRAVCRESSRTCPSQGRDIMIAFHRVKAAGMVASGAFIGLCVTGAAVTQAASVVNEVMLVNGKTGKCLTIAGGVSSENNVHTVQ